MSNNNKNSKAPQIVHYIVGVHGIGQQRKNETILAIIEQFSAIRHDKADKTKLKNILTLGRLTSESKEKLWIEYINIPNSPDSLLKRKKWIPFRVKNKDAKNLRFVDFCWESVMREHHDAVGESTKVWTDSLLNRLKLRLSLEKIDLKKEGKEESSPTEWITNMMETMQDGMLFLEKLMSVVFPAMSKEIFGEFLGDAEVYGNFPHTRGQAVRMFHETMAKVHQAHLDEFEGKENVKPCYTIIAHSLGTVLTMDAITYAYAKSRKNKSDQYHFSGYEHSLLSRGGRRSSDKPVSSENLDVPSVEWVEHLTSYVTLGSPIDKYLALWTENYFHLTDTSWMNKTMLKNRKDNKIRHFNYSDEQDLVGHQLNILQSTPVWKEIAEIGEDVVFTGSPYPGKAHVDYWTNYKLFKRILDLAIDEKDKNKEELNIQWFDAKVYRNSILISFVAIPSIGWLIATFSLYYIVASLLLLNQGFDLSLLIISAVFLITAYLTHIMMKLLIEWHVVLDK